MSRRRKKPRDPNAHLGVYKRLSDVKGHHRLGDFEAAYTGRDVWAEWLEDVGRPESKTQRDRYRRTKETWYDHMDEQGRHPALPDPQHVEGYAAWLLKGRKLVTVLPGYWTPFSKFFEYLTWHEQYDHRYNPVAMAANNYDATRQIWDAHREYVSNGGVLPEDYKK